MKLRPIETGRGSLADLAYESLSSALLSGALLPGERLVMDAVAEQLQISRTPVRDALRRLEAEGTIKEAGRRGFVVREFTEDDARHLYDARVSIEGFCARQVAEKGGEAIAHVEQALDDAIRTSADSINPEIEYQSHMKVHRAFVEATGNSVLLELFDVVWARARGQAAFADYLAHATDGTRLDSDHRPLVAALHSGPDKAFEAMRVHIREGLHVHLS